MTPSLYPPPPCAECKLRRERVRLPGERCLSLRLKVEERLKRAASLSRLELEKLLAKQQKVKLLIEGRTCEKCAEKIASWVA